MTMQLILTLIAIYIAGTFIAFIYEAGYDHKRDISSSRIVFWFLFLIIFLIKLIIKITKNLFIDLYKSIREEL